MRLNKIDSEEPEGVGIFIDLNETLIRTGAISADTRQQELSDLTKFSSICRQIATRFIPAHLVFVTGNTFEYARRIEEPLGLRLIPGLEVSVVSENGLLGRSFCRGDLWIAHLKSGYQEFASQFLSDCQKHPQLAGQWISQGNERRITLKPVANTFSLEEIRAAEHIFSQKEGSQWARMYTHRFYIDLDPLEVTINGEDVQGPGKDYGVRRMVESFGGPEGLQLIGIGDSASDEPMFKAINSFKGRSYLVSNSTFQRPGTSRTTKSFAAGVIEVMSEILAP